MSLPLHHVRPRYKCILTHREIEKNVINEKEADDKMIMARVQIEHLCDRYVGFTWLHAQLSLIININDADTRLPKIYQQFVFSYILLIHLYVTPFNSTCIIL